MRVGKKGSKFELEVTAMWLLVYLERAAMASTGRLKWWSFNSGRPLTLPNSLRTLAAFAKVKQ
mgnify:FL=1